MSYLDVALCIGCVLVMVANGIERGVSRPTQAQ